VYINKNLDINIFKRLTGNKLFWINKRLFDILVALLLIPVLLVFSVILPFFNILFNRGSLFFIQDRMGKECSVFSAIKFRTMVPTKEITRKYNDPIETNRITSLGKILRKCRIDELPQILNVLKGEMSLIGPRPDCYTHALEYLKSINGYRERYTIRPGITGLSQVRLGYAEGLEATEKKVEVDNYYIKNISYITELEIIFKTVFTILRGVGK